jgi:hypothetical protein
MQRVLIFLSLLAFALPEPHPVAAASRCINDWSEAAPIVRKEGLFTVEELTVAARAHIKGNIIKTTLCQDDGVWVFRLIVRHKGNLSMMTVNAKTPFPR